MLFESEALYSFYTFSDESVRKKLLRDMLEYEKVKK